AALHCAHALLSGWLAQSDGLPVHDQLDRIYFEADVIRRYAAAVPRAMRDPVLANLHAFMQRALDTDAGRYPSLPRFLHELVDLADASAQEAPDEGIVGDAGDAVRIYTVHGAKGLEAPIVWLLDAAAGQEPGNAYDVMVDWPPEAHAPSHFSVCTKKAEQSACQQRLAESEGVLVRREALNLLYVAMTRAQQALIVSGCDGKGLEDSWYEKVRSAVRAAAGLGIGDDVALSAAHGDALENTLGKASPLDDAAAAYAQPAMSIDPRMTEALPTGVRHPAIAGRGQHYGTRFHRLMERITVFPSGNGADRAAIQRDLGVADREFTAMWDSATRLLSEPALARFFDPAQYRRAANELAYVDAAGEVRRIDRLVEFAEEVWVLDYKTGEPPKDAALMALYEEQMQTYGAAVAAIVPGKAVKALLIFASGAHQAVAIR
ncbi:MAG TPA: 3'-5' exonuclease, partial [Burkholderiales bacterium]|nr:3'-5' exonuclease [Burkholderiales bacterium]